MLTSDDHAYFERRAAQERARAAACDRFEIGRIHVELADRYSALLAPPAAPVMRVAAD